MDSWGIDVVLTAAQKCFGVPPGLAVLVFSEKAMGKRRDLGTISAYYADILRWLPIMKDPSKYFSTPCVNEIRAFYEGTNIILEEGLANRFLRHRKTAAALRNALQTLGFSIYTKDTFLADTLSVVLYPNGIEDSSFRSTYLNNGIIVAGGLGPLAGKVFRRGHMGNLSQNQAEFAVSALETTLETLNHPFEPGGGVKAFRETMNAG
jgi:aspartate aminotransferase-like enzyme